MIITNVTKLTAQYGIIAYQLKVREMLNKQNDEPGKPGCSRWVRSGVIAGLVVTILFGLTIMQSCGDDTQDIIRKAYTATENLQSYRMVGSNTSTVEGDSSIFTYEETFTAPDRYYSKIDIDGKTFEFINIGDEGYVRSTDPSQTAAHVVSFTQESIPEHIKSFTNFEKLDDETIDGVSYFHYRGKVDIDRMINEWKNKVDPAQPEYEDLLMRLEQFRNTEMEIKLLIDKNNYYIRQFKEDTLGPMQSKSTFERNYYDLNEPIVIEPPRDISGELLPDWQLTPSHSGIEPVQTPSSSKTPTN